MNDPARQHHHEFDKNGLCKCGYFDAPTALKPRGPDVFGVGCERHTEYDKDCPDCRVLTGVDKTLAEREKRYGSFRGHAVVTQGLKRVMQDSPKWAKLSDDKKEALEMVAHKIGRILNGDPEYRDSWHDICGYARLVEETLKEE